MWFSLFSRMVNKNLLVGGGFYAKCQTDRSTIKTCAHILKADAIFINIPGPITCS